jgi:hypothetical protein
MTIHFLALDLLIRTAVCRLLLLSVFHDHRASALAGRQKVNVHIYDVCLFTSIFYAVILGRGGPQPGLLHQYWEQAVEKRALVPVAWIEGSACVVSLPNRE